MMKRILFVLNRVLESRPAAYILVMTRKGYIVDLAASRAHALILRDEHEMTRGERLDLYHVGLDHHGPPVSNNVIDIKTGQPLLSGLMRRTV